MSNETNVEILYEDTDIVAVNKPAGLMVHPDGKSKGPFLTDWILERFPDAVNVGEPARTPEGDDIARPGIVHRLDRDTSGVMLVAKTERGFECLKKQFQARTIKKKYGAFVWGDLKEDFGTINRPIGRSGSDFRRWSAMRGARGEMRDAETYWTKKAVVESASDGEEEDGKRDEKGSGKEGKSRKEKFTLIEAEPKTGRTHQIRVHFAAIQHPVVGDVLYAPKRPPALGFKRTALQARSIEFDNCEGKRIKVEAPLPGDFRAAYEALKI